VLMTNLATGFIGTGGLIAAKTTGMNTAIKSITTQKATFQAHLDNMQKRYTHQFNALDSMLSSMQSTQSYMTQQLAALSANSVR
jgi:flagellar hook-associated protein 2